MKHINVGLFVPHNGCPNQCSFCNQKAISGSKEQVTPKKIDKAVEIAVKNPDSVGGEIAFFGGSFTAIDRETMIALLESAYGYVSRGLFKGIRISTRPDAIDDEICSILKKYGVTAVELGAQSMDDTVLAANGRGHTADDVVSASCMLRDYGFSLGLQMMTGLYGSCDEDSIMTAEKLIELKPDTVRIYPTVVLENTRLAELYRNGEYRPQTVDEAVELCSKLLLMFNRANIKVIRLGLHSGGEVEGEFVAGAYHPALRELCESKIYLDKALDIICRKNIPTGRIAISVSPKSISKMTGQKRKNIDILRDKGYEVKICPDSSLSEYQVNIQKDETICS
ncbi:MAG: radical SAM protein [Clostridia bacterium]|nr:radical SAM protein [Clostridia bacterium]